MIAVRVQREPSEHGGTLGSLYIDDRFVCWTLEDPIREPKPRPVPMPISDAEEHELLTSWVRSWKMPGTTAIPSGRYELVMEWSPRFSMNLPEMKRVPGFSETKIHAANRADELEGCIAVGITRGLGAVFQSRDALSLVIARLHPMRSERMFIDVINPPGLHLPLPPSIGERFV